MPERRVGRRPWVLVLVALLAVAAGYLARRAFERAPGGGPAGAADGGTTRLEFSLSSLTGTRVAAADYEGRVLVVDFWASWCGPCRIQAEILRGLQEDYRGEAVSFVAVNVGEPEDLVRQYVEDEPFSYPVLMDPTQDVSLRYGVYALPTVMVVARDRTIGYTGVGISSAERIAAAVDRALAAAG